MTGATRDPAALADRIASVASRPQGNRHPADRPARHRFLHRLLRDLLGQHRAPDQGDPRCHLRGPQARPRPSPPRRTEGDRDARWILLDYWDVVVHIFTPDAREYYRLENLWARRRHGRWADPFRRGRANMRSCCRPITRAPLRVSISELAALGSNANGAGSIVSRASSRSTLKALGSRRGLCPPRVPPRRDRCDRRVLRRSGLTASYFTPRSLPVGARCTRVNPVKTVNGHALPLPQISASKGL